jgi:hypothetical protein
VESQSIGIFKPLQDEYEVLHIPEMGNPTRWLINVSSDPFDLDSAASEIEIRGFRDCIRTAMSASAFDPSDESNWLVRLRRCDPLRLQMTIQPVTRSDYLLTNLAGSLNLRTRCDGQVIAVRDLATEPSGAFIPLEASIFANNIGAACALRIAGGQWVWAKRRKSVSFDPNMISCPVSGGLIWSDVSSGSDFEERIISGVLREAREELGLDLTARDISYLGLARERRRCGKPQLFFLIDLPALSSHDLQLMWQHSPDGLKEFEMIGCATDLRELIALSSEFQVAMFLAKRLQGLA